MADDPKNSDEIALLAHDLRTPLAAMRTTAELIAKGELSELQNECLAILLNSIDALSDMTGELIHSVLPEAPRAGFPKDAAVLIREVSDLFRPMAERKGLCFELALEGNEVLIEAMRAVPLRRVVTTLIDNAIKYTGEGSVTVTLQSESADGQNGASLKISVADTGPGIDPMERHRLFAPFVRGRTGRESGEGAGLGLWGAVQLVKGLGGKLRLISPKSGGCRFEIFVPLTEGLEPVSDTQAVEGFDNDRRVDEHVLIVDDNETNRRLLSALLESFGMTCDQAESGPEAIEMLRARAFDAVLLDLHMPGMTGLEASAKLREVRAGEKIPLIAVTAAMESIGDRRVKEAGFLEVLAKPLSPAHLFQALEHAREYRRNGLKPEVPVPS